MGADPYLEAVVQHQRRLLESMRPQPSRRCEARRGGATVAVTVRLGAIVAVLVVVLLFVAR